MLRLRLLQRRISDNITGQMVETWALLGCDGLAAHRFPSLVIPRHNVGALCKIDQQLEGGYFLFAICLCSASSFIINIVICSLNENQVVAVRKPGSDLLSADLISSCNVVILNSFILLTRFKVSFFSH